MTISIPLFAQDQSYPAWLLRRQYLSMFGPGVSSTLTDFLVTPASGLQVNISAGDGYVQQSVATSESGADKGLYYIRNDSPVNPANTISAPVSNPRVDAIVMRVYDITEQTLSGKSFAQFEWVTGTPTSGATIVNLAGAPASLPANSLLIAYVLVPVSATSLSSGNILMMTKSATLKPTTWAPLALVSGLTTLAGANVPSVRVSGDKGELKGSAQNTSGSTMSSPSPICTLPTAYCPVAQVLVATSSSLVLGIAISITPAGVMTFSTTGATGLVANDSILLDGLKYPLS